MKEVGLVIIGGGSAGLDSGEVRKDTGIKTGVCRERAPGRRGRLLKWVANR